MKTKITELLGIEYPIVQGAMAWIAEHHLAAAVSKAGGLGIILNEKIGWREYSSVGMILAVLFVTVFIIETISRAARRRLVQGGEHE